jgi:hypothetical protein
MLGIASNFSTTFTLCLKNLHPSDCNDGIEGELRC